MSEQQCTRWTCDGCGRSEVTDDVYDDGGALDEPGWTTARPAGWYHHEHNGKRRLLCSDCYPKLDALIEGFFSKTDDSDYEACLNEHGQGFGEGLAARMRGED